MVGYQIWLEGETSSILKRAFGLHVSLLFKADAPSFLSMGMMEVLIGLLQ